MSKLLLTLVVIQDKPYFFIFKLNVVQSLGTTDENKHMLFSTFPDHN